MLPHLKIWLQIKELFLPKKHLQFDNLFFHSYNNYKKYQRLGTHLLVCIKRALPLVKLHRNEEIVGVTHQTEMCITEPQVRVSCLYSVCLEHQSSICKSLHHIFCILYPLIVEKIYSKALVSKITIVLTRFMSF